MNDSVKQIEILQRTIKRERAAREQAEHILEQKSAELNSLNSKLKKDQTDLKDSLDQKKSEFEGLLLSIKEIYLMVDLNGNIINTNEQAIEQLNIHNGDNIQPIFSNLQTEQLKQANQFLENVLANGFITDFPIEIQLPLKGLKQFELNASVLYNKKNHPIAIQGTAKEIGHTTSGKKSGMDCSKELDFIIQKAPVGVMLSKEPDYDYFNISEKVFNILSYSDNEFDQKGLRGIIHPIDRNSFRDELSKLKNDQTELISTEKRFITKQNKIRWGKITIQKIKDTCGNLRYYISLLEDITEERSAIEHLKESETKLISLIENLQIGVLLEDKNRQIVLANDKFCEMFNLPVNAKELTGKYLAEIGKSQMELLQDRNQIDLTTQKIISDKKIVHGNEFAMKNGHTYERDYIPLYINGLYTGHLWTYNEITLIKNYTQRIKEEKEKYVGIIENMKLGLLEVSLKGEVKIANQWFLSMSGFSLDELKHDPLTKLIPQFENQNRNIDFKDLCLNKTHESFEIKVRVKSGKKRIWMVSGNPSYSIEGKIIGAIIICLDINDKKKLELQKEKLLANLKIQNEQLNEYAHIVSHDLKSPLRSISALLSWTIEDAKSESGKIDLENLNMMQDKVEKMDLLIGNILNYSSLDTVKLAVNEIAVKELIKEVKHIIHNPNNVKIIPADNLPIIYADKTRIQQVFQNLIGNAVNYNDKPDGIIEINYSSNPTHHIFSIKDNGVGIKEEDFDRIFKAFNSLGKNEHSTGLGLNIVKKIIRLYHGEIWLESTYKVGTTFFFSIKKDMEEKDRVNGS